MTCYFRHLGSAFKKAGIDVTPENKKEIDEIIHLIVGVEYPNCPAAWKRVKERIANNEAVFLSNLRDAWETAKKH